MDWLGLWDLLDWLDKNYDALVIGFVLGVLFMLFSEIDEGWRWYK
jgi:predicted negative regulator of RcsB-dependent stress response